MLEDNKTISKITDIFELVKQIEGELVLLDQNAIHIGGGQHAVEESMNHISAQLANLKISISNLLR